MEKTSMKKSFWKLLVKRLLWGIILAILLGIIGIYALWHNEIETVLSLQEIRPCNSAKGDGAVYMMKVKGDCYMADFLKQGGVKNDAELIDFATSHITKGLFDIPIEVSDTNCSSFTAITADGDRLFGRNDDWRSNICTCIVFTEASGERHATVSSVRLYNLGIGEKGVQNYLDKIKCIGTPYIPLDGMNDAGVSCGIYSTFQGSSSTGTGTDINTDKPDIVSYMLIRMILDYADDVDEAVEIAKSFDLHEIANSPNHYMVADSSGRSAILEWVNSCDVLDNDGSKRELVVTYNDDDAHVGEREAACDYQWVTNFIVQPNYYDSDYTKFGYDRYEKLYDKLSATNGVVADERAAMDILDYVSFDGKRTIYSVIYNLTDKSVLWVCHEHYDDETAIFEFKLD